jgi:hypothetical protein
MPSTTARRAVVLVLAAVTTVTVGCSRIKDKHASSHNDSPAAQADPEQTQAAAGADTEGTSGAAPLPAPATWESDKTELPDPLPPLLKEAHKVAADYMGLSLDEVYFAEVRHEAWGQSYVFARKDEYSSCEVQVPGLKVHRARLPKPWKYPQADELRLPLSENDAVRIGEAYVVTQLGVALDSLRRVPPFARRNSRMWHLNWLRERDGVLVPGYVQVQIGVQTGEVLRFANQEFPVDVSLTPRLSKQEAVRRARAWLVEHGGKRTTEQDKLSAKATDVELEVQYFPIMSPTALRAPGQQHLAWMVHFAFELPADSEPEFLHPTQTKVYVDAHTGTVLETMSRPACPR